MNAQVHKKEGFTIIEVVLVLAIAGLIFLMVFIALPALQRSQRNTQRKDDLSRINTQINNYITNNKSNIPANLTVAATGQQTFVQKYLAGTDASTAGAEYSDPQAGPYKFVDGSDGTKQPTLDASSDNATIVYTPKYICGTDGDLVGGSSKQYALQMKLEGQASNYCLDNH